MKTQYPLIFPYGEDGHPLGIHYNNECNKNTRKRQIVTMWEFYAYMLQTRRNQGKNLIMGGQLLRQYIVDAYTIIEEDKMAWVRNNQPNLRTKY